MDGSLGSREVRSGRSGGEGGSERLTRKAKQSKASPDAAQRFVPSGPAGPLRCAPEQSLQCAAAAVPSGPVPSRPLHCTPEQSPGCAAAAVVPSGPVPSAALRVAALHTRTTGTVRDASACRSVRSLRQAAQHTRTTSQCENRATAVRSGPVRPAALLTVCVWVMCLVGRAPVSRPTTPRCTRTHAGALLGPPRRLSNS